MYCNTHSLGDVNMVSVEHHFITFLPPPFGPLEKNNFRGKIQRHFSESEGNPPPGCSRSTFHGIHLIQKIVSVEVKDGDVSEDSR